MSTAAHPTISVAGDESWEHPSVPWKVRYGPTGTPGEREFRLVVGHEGDDEVVRRRVVCPTVESIAVGDALKGTEYPLNSSIVNLVRAMPVIDIGSHCGGTVAYWEEMLDPSVVLAFEPNPDAFKYLKRNAGDAVVCANMAVGGQPGKAQFHKRELMYLGGLYASHLPHEIIDVEMMDGDGVAHLVTQPDIGLVKIDAESSEVPILYSMRRHLSRVRVLFIEYHDESNRRAIDALLHNFVQFHSAALFGQQQGTVGYVHSRFVRSERPPCQA